MDILPWVNRYDELAKELAAKYRDRATGQSEQIKAENTAWSYGAGLGVTERRETARAAGAQFAALVVQDTGEIEALTIELAFAQAMIRLIETGKL